MLPVVAFRSVYIPPDVQPHAPTATRSNHSGCFPARLRYKCKRCVFRGYRSTTSYIWVVVPFWLTACPGLTNRPHMAGRRSPVGRRVYPMSDWYDSVGFERCRIPRAVRSGGGTGVNAVQHGAERCSSLDLFARLPWPRPRVISLGPSMCEAPRSGVEGRSPEGPPTIVG